MNKKGQGLSLNTIIIAIIVLTVLVVIIAVFSGAMAKILPGFSDCTNKGTNYKCVPGDSCTGDNEGYTQKDVVFTCPKDKGQTCCKKPTNTFGE